MVILYHILRDEKQVRFLVYFFLDFFFAKNEIIGRMMGNTTGATFLTKLLAFASSKMTSPCSIALAINLYNFTAAIKSIKVKIVSMITKIVVTKKNIFALLFMKSMC